VPTMDTSAIVMGALGLQSDDEHMAVAILQYLDRRVVEAAQALSGDDLLRLSNREPAVRDVEDAVHDRQQGVDVVRDEQDREAISLGEGCDQFGNHVLVSEVEAGKRLIQQEHLRLPGQRLGQQEPLLLTTRETADRAVGIGSGLHLGNGTVDPLAGIDKTPTDRHAPPAAINAEVHEVTTANGQVGIDIAALGDVADRRIPATWMAPQDEKAARGRRQQAEEQAKQCRLATSIRPQYRDEFAAIDREAGVLPDEAIAIGRAQTLGDDGR